MILLAAALVALADPPRGEVFAGGSGTPDQSYGYLAVHHTVARNREARLFLRGGGSHLAYRFDEGERTLSVSSPGATLGVGAAFDAATTSLGVAASLEGRWTTSTPDDGAPTRVFESGGVLSSQLFWTARRRTAVFAMGSISGANGYLWSRAGALHQAVPRLRRDTDLQLWLGADATARGNRDVRGLEIAALAELRSRDLRGAIAARAGVALEDTGDRQARQPTLGASAYWRY